MFEGIRGIQKTNHATADLLKQMMDEGAFRDKNEAFTVLRATLKALRDRLQIGEAVHLGGQLPALLRGFYYESWDHTHHTDKSRNADQFLETVKFHLHGHGDLDLWVLVPIALKVVLISIDPGEALQVVRSLPQEVQQLCA